MGLAGGPRLPTLAANPGGLVGCTQVWPRLNGGRALAALPTCANKLEMEFGAKPSDF